MDPKNCCRIEFAGGVEQQLVERPQGFELLIEFGDGEWQERRAQPGDLVVEAFLAHSSTAVASSGARTSVRQTRPGGAASW